MSILNSSPVITDTEELTEMVREQSNYAISTLASNPTSDDLIELGMIMSELGSMLFRTAVYYSTIADSLKENNNDAGSTPGDISPDSAELSTESPAAEGKLSSNRELRDRQDNSSTYVSDASPDARIRPGRGEGEVPPAAD